MQAQTVWTYTRGKWTSVTYDLATPRERLAWERVQKWGWQQRWERFPQLGSMPERWLSVGARPSGMLSLVNEILIYTYLGPVGRQLNEESILLKYLR